MNPIIALIIANIIWGAASPIFKFSLSNIPPFTLAFIRFFFAGFLFLPFVIGKWQSLTVKQWFTIFLGAFFGITINITFFFLGLERSASINAPIIASAGPVFLYFMSVFYLKELLNLKVFFGMLISLGGVLFIILSPIFFESQRYVFGEIQGNIFFVLATLGAILHPLVYKNLLKKINVYQVTLVGFFFSSSTFLPFAVKELTTWSFSQLNVAGLTGIIFGVFFSSALAYFLFVYGLSKIKAQEIGLFTYIDPIVAVLIAVPLLKEYPNLYFFIGSLLVFGGIFVAENRLHWHPFGRTRNHKLLETIE